MHYLQLFITKHEDECYDNDDLDYISEQAEQKIDEFLEPYQDNKWDWYVLGGRWADLFGGRVTVPYKEALPKLKEMLADRERKLEEGKERVLQAINGTSDNKSMDGFYVKQYGELLGNYYTDEPMFYDLDYYDAFHLVDEKEDLDKYYVTVVDLHN
jgi:hypothetical protein